MANTQFSYVALASRATAIVDDTGLVVKILPPLPPNWEDLEGEVCECEEDWNCPLHAGRAGTWIETRYTYDGEPEWAL
jgi:hypothetical protein